MQLRGVVLVEGPSDGRALATLARRRGRDLEGEGVAIVPMGGYGNLPRLLGRYRDVRLAGLYDVGEERHFLRALACEDRAELERVGFYACTRDLEDELTRAVGPYEMERVLAGQGDLRAFRTYQKQPAHRARPLEEQLHGFMWNRKQKYAVLLVEALDLERVPRPLDRVLSHVHHYAAYVADTTAEVTIVPANEASWEDLQTVFGGGGDPSRCWCQRFKMAPGESWANVGAAQHALRLRNQSRCGHPHAATTTGLVAYLDGEPVGWCAVEPRSAYPRMLRNNRVPWDGRNEDKSDSSVWAVTCFVTRKGFRRRGIATALAREAVEFARQWGARAVEGYPMTTKDVLLGELHVGTQGMFAAAGYLEVSRPSVRRVVMRIDFR